MYFGTDSRDTSLIPILNQAKCWNSIMDYVRGAVPALKECYENMTRFTGDMELFKTFAGAYVACRDLPKEETGTLIATKRHHDNAYSRRKMITHPIRAYRNHKATKKDK